MTEQVAAALRGLPSHGWTRGMFGRRDRWLLVLSQFAGVPYQHLAQLTVGEVTVIDGTLTANSATRAYVDAVVLDGCNWVGRFETRPSDTSQDKGEPHDSHRNIDHASDCC